MPLKIEFINLDTDNNICRKEPVGSTTIKKFKPNTPSTHGGRDHVLLPPSTNLLAPSPASTRKQNTAPFLQLGCRKDDWQISPLRRKPVPLFPRVQGYSWRTDTPRTTSTVVSFKMKPNPNWLQVPEKPRVTSSSRQCGQNTADCKGWVQQPARITEFLARKNGTVYGAVLKFWKEDRAAGTLALGSSNPTGDVLNPGIKPAEVQDEVSNT